MRTRPWTRSAICSIDRSTHERTTSKEPRTPKDCGPMWLGPLADKDFLGSMKMPDSLAEKDRCAKYMDLWKEELDVPYFFENNELSSVAKLSPPRARGPDGEDETDRAGVPDPLLTHWFQIRPDLRGNTGRLPGYRPPMITKT